MKKLMTAVFAFCWSSAILAGSTTVGGVQVQDIDGSAPGPGIFALLALGVVGAIGIARLRK